jgi:hypothetical protein
MWYKATYGEVFPHDAVRGPVSRSVEYLDQPTRAKATTTPRVGNTDGVINTLAQRCLALALPGLSPSIAIGVDGLPIIQSFDSKSWGAGNVLRQHRIHRRQREQDCDGSVGHVDQTSLAIGADGPPTISYLTRGCA